MSAKATSRKGARRKPASRARAANGRGNGRSTRIDRVKAEGVALGPWQLQVEITPELSTATLNAELEAADRAGFYDPRDGLHTMLSRIYPDGLQGRSVLDCGCNCGAYSFAAKELGAGTTFGFDAREQWIRQAEFLLKHRADRPKDMTFALCNLYDLPKQRTGRFDITLFPGLFYHLPDPVAGLKIAADLTDEVLILGTTSHGGYPDGLLVAGFEPTAAPLAGTHGLQWFPSGPRVLRRILEWLGFQAVRCVDWWSPPDQYQPLDSIIMVAARNQALLQNFDQVGGWPRDLQALYENVAPRSTVLVALDPGDESTVDLRDRVARRFPAPGRAARLRTRELIQRLERMRERGAEYLFVPRRSLGWFEDKSLFAQYLDLRYDAVVKDADACFIYRLQPELRSIFEPSQTEAPHRAPAAAVSPNGATG